MPTNRLKPVFFSVSASAYLLQAIVWAFLVSAEQENEVMAVRKASAFIMVAFSLLALFGFVAYGTKLWFLLSRFPAESRGRGKKLKEVSLVTLLCSISFLTRAVVLVIQALWMDQLGLDVAGHPLVNFIYYTFVEILPAASVLWILRKLPPRRPRGYTPLRGEPGPSDQTQQRDGSSPEPPRQQEEQDV